MRVGMRGGVGVRGVGVRGVGVRGEGGGGVRRPANQIWIQNPIVRTPRASAFCEKRDKQISKDSVLQHEQDPFPHPKPGIPQAVCISLVYKPIWCIFLPCFSSPNIHRWLLQ